MERLNGTLRRECLNLEWFESIDQLNSKLQQGWHSLLRIIHKSQWKGDFRYGRFEARMKFPTTQGMWPFWMLPTESVYGGWPGSGEIDIVEMIGKKPGQAVGTIHTGMPYAYSPGFYDLPPGEIFADTFHIFAIEWEPDTITWFIDGIQYHQLTPNDMQDLIDRSKNLIPE